MSTTVSYIIGISAITLFIAQHVLKSLYTSSYLHLNATGREGSRCLLRASNRSWFAATEASLLITITDMTEEDIRDFGDPNKSAYITTKNPIMVADSFVCWSFAYTKNPNPPIMTLSSKQTLHAEFLNFRDDLETPEKLIEIASENGFFDPQQSSSDAKSMVFLAWRKYTGTIKFVSKDCFTKSWDFTIDPDDTELPLRVW